MTNVTIECDNYDTQMWHSKNVKNRSIINDPQSMRLELELMDKILGRK